MWLCGSVVEGLDPEGLIAGPVGLGGAAASGGSGGSDGVSAALVEACAL